MRYEHDNVGLVTRVERVLSGETLSSLTRFIKSAAIVLEMAVCCSCHILHAACGPCLHFLHATNDIVVAPQGNGTNQKQDVNSVERLDVEIETIPNSPNDVMSILIDVNKGVCDFSFGHEDNAFHEKYSLSYYEQGAVNRVKTLLPKFEHISIVPSLNDYPAIVTYRGVTNTITRALQLPARLDTPIDGFVCIGDDDSKDAYYSVLRLYRLLLPRIREILKTHQKKGRV